MTRNGAILITAVFVAVGLSGCVAEATGSDLRVPQDRSIGPREAEWTIDSWPASDPLPIYATERSCCTGADVWRAADALGIEPVPKELDWPDHMAFGDDGASLTVGLDDGRVTARWDRGHDRIAAPDREEVTDRARGILEAAGLWPESGRLTPGDPRTSAGHMQGRMDVANETSESVVTERRVDHGARLDGYPVVGVPHLRVDFAAGGDLARVSALWPELEAGGTVELVDPQEVPRLFEARAGVVQGEVLCTSYHFTKVDLIYYAGAPGWEPEWAFPAYRATGGCADGEGRVSFVVSAVRNAH